MSESKDQWFLETDAFTNESVAEFLASEGIVAESVSQFKDKKGKTRHVWNVPYRIITLLKNSEKTFPFKYRVFVRSGGRAIRPFTLHRKKKISVHSRRAQERLREIGARK